MTRQPVRLVRRPPRQRLPWESPVINRRGGSRAWTRLVAQVVKEEPFCRLQLPGCTIRSQTADHIQPKKYRPDLADKRGNLRGSCHHCNRARGTRPLAQARTEMLAATPRKRRQPAAITFFQKAKP